MNETLFLIGLVISILGDCLITYYFGKKIKGWWDAKTNR